MIDLASSLALSSLYLSAPNPRVGCVLTTASGNIIGQGFTQQAGGAHAEVMALRDVASKGESSQNATAYVTLEPCTHFGRTPPCCHALIEAKIAKVVIAAIDPNPLVAGKGLRMLQSSGIEVSVLQTDHIHAIAARELNIGFFSRMVRKAPWVRMKVAASLDGKTSLSNGTSQWITGEAARADGHAWRARACAILTGIGTVRVDDPMLDVRFVETHRQPHLVIVDSRLETPPTAKLFRASAARKLFIYCAINDSRKRVALESLGATVIFMPGKALGTEQKVDLAAMLEDLGRREINELHVEAGHKLHGSLIRENLVDEILLYVAPKLIGPGLDMADLSQLDALRDGVQLYFRSVDCLGPDLRILARIVGHDTFLHP